jgi:hypothetical protein
MEMSKVFSSAMKRRLFAVVGIGDHPVNIKSKPVSPRISTLSRKYF